mgnify:CR=1 FL=1
MASRIDQRIAVIAQHSIHDFPDTDMMRADLVVRDELALKRDQHA